MIEIRNKEKGPVQLVVRSFSKNRQNTSEMGVLNIYGNNIFFVEDERIIDRYLKQRESEGLLSWRKIDKETFAKVYDPKNPRMRYVPGYRHNKKEIEEN